MKTIEGSGKIEKGNLIIHNENVFQQQIQDIGFANHVHWTLEYGNKRTIDQNSYLWGGIVTPLFVKLRQEGWEYKYPKQVYRELEEGFCKEEVVNRETGEVRETVIPFKKLDTEQFAEKVDQIRSWVNNSNKIDLYLKAPHEYYEMTWTAYDRWKQGEINKTEAIEESRPVADQAKETINEISSRKGATAESL